MRTSFPFQKSRRQLITLLIAAGLVLTAIAYPVFTASPPDLTVEPPAVAGPELGSGSGGGSGGGGG